jgi:protein TonB
MSIRHLLNGRVLVEVTVDKRGCGTYFVVIRSSGVPALDEAALDLAARIEYRPAERDGEPLETQMRLPINFSLTGATAANSSVPTSRH